MKKSLYILSILFLSLTACSTDDGPGQQGPQGPPGEDGLDGLGYTLEQTVNFEYFSDENLYSALINIPETVTTINPDADAVLVYRLEVVEAEDGSDLDSWSLIPQNFFLSEGTIQYVYNHTVTDVEIIIDGNFDLSSLDPGFTDNQTFRIVVVPSDFASTSGVNVQDYHAVMSALGIQENDVRELRELQ